MSIESDVIEGLREFKTMLSRYMSTLTGKHRYTRVKLIDTPNEYYLLCFNVRTKRIIKVHVLLDMNKAVLLKLPVVDIFCEESSIKFDLERKVETKNLYDKIKEWRDGVEMDLVEKKMTS